MRTNTKWWIAAPLALGLIVAACNDDGADATDAPAETEAPAAATAAPAAETEAPASEADAGDVDAAIASFTFGEEVVPLTRVLCYFEEQPRAGLGGTWTHTAQASGTNAAGEPVILDVSRAVGEDGTVDEEVIVDIGEPGAEDAVGLRGGGGDGTIAFGDASFAVESIEVTDFESDPVMVSFDISC